jgi:hypothetical protein
MFALLKICRNGIFLLRPIRFIKTYQGFLRYSKKNDLAYRIAVLKW